MGKWREKKDVRKGKASKKEILEQKLENIERALEKARKKDTLRKAELEKARNRKDQELKETVNIKKKKERQARHWEMIR